MPKQRNKRTGDSWDSRASKRERFLEEPPRRKRGKGLTLYVVGVGALLLSIVVGLVTMEQSAKSSSSGGGGKTAVTAVDGAVTLPVADFAGPYARFYTYKSPQDKTISFFVLKSSDGVIRAAFDACDVCFPYKKGYRQEGDQMVCNNCGQRFPSVRINIEEGGCNPAPLIRNVSGDNLIILEKDLALGAKFF